MSRLLIHRLISLCCRMAAYCQQMGQDRCILDGRHHGIHWFITLKSRNALEKYSLDRFRITPCRNTASPGYHLPVNHCPRSIQFKGTSLFRHWNQIQHQRRRLYRGQGHWRVTYATAPLSTGVTYVIGLGFAYLSPIVFFTTSSQGYGFHLIA